MTDDRAERIVATLEVTGCLCLLAIIPVAIVVCGMCWEYTIDSWLNYAEKPEDFPLWGGCLLAILPVLGQLSIPGAIGTWIALMFIA